MLGVDKVAILLEILNVDSQNCTEGAAPVQKKSRLQSLIIKLCNSLVCDAIRFVQFPLMTDYNQFRSVIQHPERLNNDVKSPNYFCSIGNVTQKLKFQIRSILLETSSGGQLVR